MSFENHRNEIFKNELKKAFIAGALCVAGFSALALAAPHMIEADKKAAKQRAVEAQTELKIKTPLWDEKGFTVISKGFLSDEFIVEKKDTHKLYDGFLSNDGTMTLGPIDNAPSP